MTTKTEVVVQPTVEDTLNDALADLIGGITDGATAAKEFLVAEIPDVAQQALLYYGVYNALLMVLAIGLFVAVYYLCKMMFVIRPDWWTKTEDASGGVIYAPVIVFSIVSIISAFTIMNVQWLKIWLAPKLWLIEYAADLAR